MLKQSVRSRKVMAAEVMRKALTSAVRLNAKTRDQLAIAVNAAYACGQSASLLMDRDYELRNTQITLLSALDALKQSANLDQSGSAQKSVKGGGDGSKLGQGGSRGSNGEGHRL